jgi:hypothetical protein
MVMTRSYEEIAALFAPQFAGITNLAMATKQPLLAHYTSLDVLEKIIKHDEVWFSNPLFMNDFQEMRFGILEGLSIFQRYSSEPAFTTACGSIERARLMRHYFDYYFTDFDTNHAFDVYVFCLSEHDPANKDGLLSMWRGYGGNGNGVALVFKTDFVTLNPASPLLLAQVAYVSEDERRGWMTSRLEECMKVLAEHAKDVPDDKLHIVAHQMFDLMKVYSLTSKHPGFGEEQEWRIIYLPDRDRSKILADRFHYLVGKNGIQPKLRFKIEPLPIDPRGTWTFESILDQIILGPSLSSQLALKAVCRMLDVNKKGPFKAKVSASNIPLRST